jgi:hypothetical protein
LTHSYNSQGSSICDINTIYDSENGGKVATYYHCGTTDRRSLYQTIGAAGAAVPSKCDLAKTLSIPKLDDHVLTNPRVFFFLIVASTTFFVDPTKNQIGINSADSSGTSRPQSSPSSSDYPSSSSSSSTSTTSTTSTSNNAVTIGGAVGGGIGGLIIICLLSYIFFQKRKRKQKTTTATTTIADRSTTHVLKPELPAVEGPGSGREGHDVVPYVDIKAQAHATTVREVELDGTERQRQQGTPVELVAGKDIRPLGKTAELAG